MLSSLIQDPIRWIFGRESINVKWNTSKLMQYFYKNQTMHNALKVAFLLILMSGAVLSIANTYPNVYLVSFFFFNFSNRNYIPMSKKKCFSTLGYVVFKNEGKIGEDQWNWIFGQGEPYFSWSEEIDLFRKVPIPLCHQIDQKYEPPSLTSL